MILASSLRPHFLLTTLPNMRYNQYRLQFIYHAFQVSQKLYYSVESGSYIVGNVRGFFCGSARRRLYISDKDEVIWRL